ncbi:MAG: DNA primase [Verrucomicrobiota bacterium]
MGRITQDSIDQVLAETDIVDVVGEHVQLKRSGGNYTGLCPFHDERTPSFNVSPSRQIYKCFGCGAGGSAFKFLMEFHRIPFPEAVKRLADKAGITLREEAGSGDEDKTAQRRAAALEVLQAAAAFFHQLLLKSPEAAEARAYLKSRGLNSEIARRWQLGYAPPESESFLAWARSQKFKARQLIDAGLAALKDEAQPKGGLYARFRDRILFPVSNDYGDTIAFSGRLLDPNAKTAKYLNSPETVLFEKSRTFYALDRTKRAILREKAVLVCEGQLDLITCVEHGIENVVAPLGTAFTEQHARILRRHAERILLCYDSDAAGQKAAERTFRQLAAFGCEVRLVRLPAGEDPDSLIRSQGPEAFRGLLEFAQEFLTHRIHELREEFAIDTASGRMQAARLLAGSISAYTENIALEAAVDQAASSLRLAREDLLRLVHQEQKRPLRRETTSGADGPTEASRSSLLDLVRQNRALARLCLACITSDQLRAQVRDSLSAESFPQIEGGELLSQLASSQVALEEPGAISQVLSRLSGEMSDWLSQALFEQEQTLTAPEVGSALKAVRRDLLARRIAEEKGRLASSDLPAHEVLSIQKEVLDLQQQLRKLGASSSL